MAKLFFTDGTKSANLLTSSDPSVWTYFSGAPRSSQQVLYGYVAAVYRAYNIKANTVGGMPFALYRGKEGYDSSATWGEQIRFSAQPVRAGSGWQPCPTWTAIRYTTS